MADSQDLTRREFIMSSGAVLVLTQVPWTLASPASAGAPATGACGSDWMAGPGKARYRIDGLAKVTGQKVFAYDFRARDLDGWPPTEHHALILRAVRVDRVYEDLDLSVLPPALRPLRTITAEELKRDRLTVPKAFPEVLLAEKGTAPAYLGQPLALLIFGDGRTMRRARHLLRRNPDAVRYGAPKAPAPARPYQPTTHLIRIAGEPEDGFSQRRDGPHDPTRAGRSDPRGTVDERARYYQEQIARDVAARGFRVFERTYATQVVDPMFLEPESGLAFYDRARGRLHLVVGTQSPHGDLESLHQLFYDEAKSAIRPRVIALHACWLGGGFGGRLTSVFPVLLGLAAAYADGPVRLAYDRFEQFQAGLKRHAAVLEERLAIDEAGRFQALEATITLNGGGKINHSPAVSRLAGISAASAYSLPRSAIHALAVYTPAPPAGSMRGFGATQAIFAVECLVDEAARELGRDPIALRRGNLLRDGDRTVTGAVARPPARSLEICERASGDPLWTGRDAARARFADGPSAYGVGFALALKAFGTDGDGVLAAVAVDADGTVEVRTPVVDMGNGSATSLALMPASYVGANATRIHLGAMAFDVLALETERPAPRKPESSGAFFPGNLHWTPTIIQASGASRTAFHHTHAVAQASRVVFESGLLPAACALWGLRPDALSAGEVRWRNGSLRAPDRPPLPLATVARRAHADGGVVKAMVHGYYSERWAEADFIIDHRRHRWPIDALAIARAGSDYALLDRRQASFPLPESEHSGRTLYAAAGSLVAVEVDRTSGEVKVLEVVLLVDAGPLIQPETVLGQAEGGVAMAIGWALHEELPPLAGGAGDGTWNMHRYAVALAGEVPLERIRIELLPAQQDEPTKGIAEAVMTPVAPAIANAVADATGCRIRSLPITPAKVKEALRSR